jgi:GNAT superfamily N-acetyltransferase
MRCEAFRTVFTQELSPEVLEAGVDAYAPEEFGKLIGGMHSFVAVEGAEPVGFCTVRVLDGTTAEILYLYIKLDRLKRGIGTKLARHAESWIAQRYPGISRLVLDTAVPAYNQAFWERSGFSRVGPSVCKYPAGDAPAVRLAKSLRSPQEQKTI